MVVKYSRKKDPSEMNDRVWVSGETSGKSIIYLEKRCDQNFKKPKSAHLSFSKKCPFEILVCSF